MIRLGTLLDRRTSSFQRNSVLAAVVFLWERTCWLQAGDLISGTPSANAIIVDPSSVYHAGIRDYLIQGGHRIVGEMQDPTEALQQLNILHPDLAIIGPNFAEHESLAVCRGIVAQQRDVKVVIVSEHWHDQLFLADAAYSKAAACLRRRVSREDFLAAINAVKAGHTLFSPEILAQAYQPIELTA